MELGYIYDFISGVSFVMVAIVCVLLIATALTTFRDIQEIFAKLLLGFATVAFVTCLMAFIVAITLSIGG